MKQDSLLETQFQMLNMLSTIGFQRHDLGSQSRLGFLEFYKEESRPATNSSTHSTHLLVDY
jgi:hypothetical protein